MNRNIIQSSMRCFIKLPVFGCLLWWMQVATAQNQPIDHSRPDTMQRAWSETISLDGDDWSLDIDPDNIGKRDRWFTSPRADARPTRVPWVIQDVFPGYHGVVWYWHEFDCPENPDPQGRFLLRFWNADYLAEVWVNDQIVGSHEGADGPFELDITDEVQVGGTNHLAVRVLNPTDEPIDGIALAETPHRNKTCDFTFGCDYNYGGLEDSVELLVTPATRVTDLHIEPDPESGAVQVNATVFNGLSEPVDAQFEVEVSPARGGNVIQTKSVEQRILPGENVISVELFVARPHLWDIDDPYLYKVSAALSRNGLPYSDGRTVRFGFRDFRIENGYFALNGCRLFLRSSHTGNMAPIGLHLPFDRNWFRQDILYTKSLGFNAIRFIAGLATRDQLDFCDEIGMLVYEEPYSAWLLQDSPHMEERFDRSISEMIRRDRNHPSVVIWGVLNETHDGAVFRHATSRLPLVRSFDDSRIVLLNSGRFDCRLRNGSIANPEMEEWEALLGGEGPQAATGLTTIYPSCRHSGDAHIYPQVPHSPDAIQLLRNYGSGCNPFFLSEYGIASPVDLIRVTRMYEQHGKEESGEAQFYRDALDKFISDWQRWDMAEVFGRPEEFFAAAQARVARQRLLGVNAVRANPNCNGYNLTGTVDQGYSGEGLTTAFREPKPGTSDALFEALAPLRLCTFVEPYHVYRGSKVCLQVVLANEDVLDGGTYPLRIDVLGPNSTVMHSKQLDVVVSDSPRDQPRPFVIDVFDESIATDWPTGKYRVRATFERDAAATGGDAEFFVTDMSEMPSIDTPIVLIGDDVVTRDWLTAQGVSVESDLEEDRRQLILISGSIGGDNGKPLYRRLLKQVACGSTVVFLSPEMLAKSGIQLPCRGHVTPLPSGVYHKEEWNRHHRVFCNMPAGGLMDYSYYRMLIPAVGWQRNGVPPKEVLAGAIQPAPGSGYASGLLLFADSFGAGQCVVCTLRIREILGDDPGAEILLRNLISFAAECLDKPVSPLPDNFDKISRELAPFQPNGTEKSRQH